MLVLSRRNRESVVVVGVDGIHRLLKVTVLGIQGGSVRLGFEVDSNVPVHRSEVWERIRDSGQQDTLTEGSRTGSVLKGAMPRQELSRFESHPRESRL